MAIRVTDAAASNTEPIEYLVVVMCVCVGGGGRRERGGTWPGTTKVDGLTIMMVR